MIDEEYLKRRPKDSNIIRQDIFEFLDKRFHPFYIKEVLMFSIQSYLWAFKDYEIPHELAYKLISEWLKKNNKKLKR